ncbi:coiled-coil domain-containing protein [Labilibaculum euxinus]
MKKNVLLFFCLINMFVGKSQTIIGDIEATQIRVYEFYNHTGEQQWLKLFRINDVGWSRGGVSGSLMFQNYYGSGGGLINFTFPQKVDSNQKPTLVLHGNASNDFDWYAYRNVDKNGNNGYDVFIKTPVYHVGFTFMVRGYSYAVFFSVEDSPQGEEIWNTSTDVNTCVFYSGNGNIGFGTREPSSKLDVAGSITATELKIEAKTADFVFEENYVLRPIEELEDYISKNKHLPEIAPAKEMQFNGVNQSEMNQKLLQKIEELTLYVIDLNKKVTDLQEENKELKNKSKK